MRKKKRSKGSIAAPITQLDPRSPVSEQYRTVRTNVQFAAVNKELTTILVTSSGPEEGKSITAANLAVTYAQQGKRTLLIDADLRKPTMHFTFGLDNMRGLSNMLVGETALEQAIDATDMENLHVITCGPIPPNPAELLASTGMEKMVNEAKAEYDIIIFDSPPLLVVADAQILSNIVDGTVLVIRSGKTEKEAAVKGKEILKSSRGKLLGAIINDHKKTRAVHYYK